MSRWMSLDGYETVLGVHIIHDRIETGLDLPLGVGVGVSTGAGSIL